MNDYILLIESFLEVELFSNITQVLATSPFKAEIWQALGRGFDSAIASK